MKKLLSVVLVLCLLAGIVSFAEMPDSIPTEVEEPAPFFEETEPLDEEPETLPEVEPETVDEESPTSPAEIPAVFEITSEPVEGGLLLSVPVEGDVLWQAQPGTDTDRAKDDAWVDLVESATYLAAPERGTLYRAVVNREDGVLFSNVLVLEGIPVLETSEATEPVMEEVSVSEDVLEEEIPVLPVLSSVAEQSATEITLAVGQSCDFPEPTQSGTQYSSSAKSIASVSSGGKIRGVAAGAATITATFGEEQTEVSVTVVKAPTKVTLDVAELTLGVGDTFTLTPTITKDSLTVLTWSVQNNGIATIDNGTVTAVAVGSTRVSVKTHNGKLAQCKITVLAAPNTVSISAQDTVIGVGQVTTLSSQVQKGAASRVELPLETRRAFFGRKRLRILGR